MSAQPLTYESVLGLIEKSSRELAQGMADSRLEFDKRMAEADRRIADSDERFDKRIEDSDERFNKRMAELAKQIEKTNQDVGGLASSVGNIVEHMIGGDNILAQFYALEYDVTDYSRNNKFGKRGTAESGQIDLLLDDGDVAILIEVKTNLKNDDVHEHIERLEKYRRWMDKKGQGKKRYVGALACAMAEDNVIQFAQKKGMYVILQLGNTVEIVPSPKGFKAKEW